MLMNLIFPRGSLNDLIRDNLGEDVVSREFADESGDPDLPDSVMEKIAFHAKEGLVGRNINDALEEAMNIWDEGTIAGVTEPQTRLDQLRPVNFNTLLEGDLIIEGVGGLCTLISDNANMGENGEVTDVKFRNNFIVEINYEYTNPA